MVTFIENGRELQEMSSLFFSFLWGVAGLCKNPPHSQLQSHFNISPPPPSLISWYRRRATWWYLGVLSSYLRTIPYGGAVKSTQLMSFFFRLYLFSPKPSRLCLGPTCHLLLFYLPKKKTIMGLLVLNPLCVNYYLKYVSEVKRWYIKGWI